jgi:hypothetical protein
MALRYDPRDFPQTGHWQRRVALANREPSSAYKPSRGEINLAEVDAIMEADERCREYLAALAPTPPRGEVR